MDEASTLSGTDVEASRAKYTEAQTLLVNEAPAAFLFDTMVVFVIPNHVSGFKYNLNYPDVRFWFYDLHPAN
jgi:ABC-type transport system substrate-binding protein